MSPLAAPEDTFHVSRAEVEAEVSRYLGLSAGGVDLRRALLELPLSSIQHFVAAVQTTREGSGRVFFMGNGGSYDNARALSALFREAGIAAATPGCDDDYARVTVNGGYDQIFVRALTYDQVGERDVVVGISGSGNSRNVVLGLSAARERGAQTFCLGGRDGGAMAGVCGPAHSIIVKNQCMEAIEDLHLLVGILVVRQLAVSSDIHHAHARLLSDFDEVISPRSLPVFVDVAEGIVRTIKCGSRVFALGMSISTNHVIADWERGATNRLPIRGVSAPLIFSQNAAMATLNDDGHYVLAHGLVKEEPQESDFALVCDVLTHEREIAAVKEILGYSGTPYVCIGGATGLSLGAFSGCEQDLFPSLIGHLASASVREILVKRFDVKHRPDITPSFLPGDRKLGRAATLKLESELRAEGRLAAGRVLVFNYGQVFEATDPAAFKLPRVFY